MEAVLEDEMGWSKKDNYCSSSEEEDEAGPAVGGTAAPIKSSASGASCNTGPKGVLEDYRQFKQFEAQQFSEREQELLALVKRVSMTCRTPKEDELAKKAEEEKEGDEDDDDSFLNEYAARRMREMMQKYQAMKNPKFGTVYDLEDADAFIKAIDEDSKTATVVLHLYEDNVKNCKVFDECLRSLAEQYTMVKFCRVRASVVGASKKLQSLGLPAALAYRDGQLIGNFVRIGDDLNEDFNVDNVEQYLKEFGILPDLSSWSDQPVSKDIVGRPSKKDESDTDSD